MRSMGRFEIMGHTDYYWRMIAREPERWEITDDECQWILDNRFDGEFFQQTKDNYWQFNVYAPELGYTVRVIMTEDGKNLHNAFNADKPIGRR